MTTETDLSWMDNFCECCNVAATTKDGDGTPLCQRCAAAGCNVAEVKCELADMDAQIARLQAESAPLSATPDTEEK